MAILPSIRRRRRLPDKASAPSGPSARYKFAASRAHCSGMSKWLIVLPAFVVCISCCLYLLDLHPTIPTTNSQSGAGQSNHNNINLPFLALLPSTQHTTSQTRNVNKNRIMLPDQDPRPPANHHHNNHWLTELHPSKIAIVQFDGRPLWQEWHVGPTTKKIHPTVWNTAAIWNWRYSQKHGHDYIYYHWPNNLTKACRSRNNKELAEAWCKVKVFLQVQEDLPHIDYFLFMDTDAVVDYRFRDQSILQVLHNMTTLWLPSWNIDERPFVLNMEGPSYWCSLVHDAHKFSHCLNTGTVFWKRSDKATAVLDQWWTSADDPYESENAGSSNHPNLGIKFRTDTPWEQVQAQSLLRNPSVNESIQIASQPEAFVQLQGPCLSDCWQPPNFEQLGCFILHFCMNKTELVEVYGTYLKGLAKEEERDMVVDDGHGGCYPRAILSMNNENTNVQHHQYGETKFDTAPCRFDWIVERALSGFNVEEEGS
mmetsp:Transcript_30190/g.55463  ORF Transcript_30190/g.55463 Transcript_30190/m.55463 type:complete len:482 (+) Transcript_30190:205-1650(+)